MIHQSASEAGGEPRGSREPWSNGFGTVAVPYRELAEHMQAGRVDDEEVVNDSLRQIRATDPLGAWSYVDEHAGQGPSQTDLDGMLGPRPTALGSLAGVTLGVKESIAVAGMPFEAGSDAFRGSWATRDASVISQLRAVGAVPLGMTVMHALGLGDAVRFGHESTGHHPWNDNYAPGGSSSGCAVATAARACRLGIGADTGGSVRGPAASCGVLGLKPTSGAIDSRGTTPLAWSMDTIGLFSREIDVLERTCAALDIVDAPARERRTVKIGAVDAETLNGSSAEIARVHDEAVQTVTDTGDFAGHVSIPEFDTAPLCWLHRMAEFRAVLNRMMAIAPERVPSSMRQIFDASMGVSLEQYHESWETGARLTAAVDDALTDCDVLLLPTAPTRSLTWTQWTGSGLDGSEVSDWYRYLVPFNITGHPAITVPWTLLDGNMPTSIQLVARHGHEATLLNAARQLQAVSNWSDRLPPRAAELLAVRSANSETS